MRNLKDLEIGIVSGGVCAGTTAWYACFSNSATRSLTPGSCTGGQSGPSTAPDSTTKYYYCAQAFTPDTQAGLRTVLTASNYCDPNDTIYGFTTNGGVASSAGMAGTGDNAGSYTISAPGCA